MSNTVDPRYLTHKKGLATCVQDAANIKKALDRNLNHAQYPWDGPCANTYEASRRIEALGTPKPQPSLTGMFHQAPQVKIHTPEENVINKKGLK